MPAMPATNVVEDAMEPEYSVLTGLLGSDDQIQMLRTFLGSSWLPKGKKWLIDNRSLERRPSLNQIMTLIELTTQYHDKIDELVVAWVAKGPCAISEEMLEEVLPFQLERFEDIDDAHTWLMNQEVYGDDSSGISRRRYRDERLGPEVGFSRLPYIPETPVEADPNLTLVTNWAIAHDDEAVPEAATKERIRKAIAARIEDALAEVEED